MNEKHKKQLIDNKWLIELHGQKFIKLHGLVWLSHQMGIKSISLNPILCDYENMIFVYGCTAEGEKGTYMAEGEATLKNTKRNMVPYLRTMSQSRAYARALRLYCGVGYTSFEELGEQVIPASTPKPKPKQSRQKFTTKPSKTKPPADWKAPMKPMDKFDARGHPNLIDFFQANPVMVDDKNGKRVRMFTVEQQMELLERYFLMKNNPDYFIETWDLEKTEKAISAMKKGELKIPNIIRYI